MPKPNATNRADGYSARAGSRRLTASAAVAPGMPTTCTVTPAPSAWRQVLGVSKAPAVIESPNASQSPVGVAPPPAPQPISPTNAAPSHARCHIETAMRPSPLGPTRMQATDGVTEPAPCTKPRDSLTESAVDETPGCDKRIRAFG
ncbi:hypothetical protein D3C72_1743600 [compost metagenome]